MTANGTHPTDTTTLVAQTYAERRRLAEILSQLTPEQWGAPSLCEGWRVRDVVAHMSMPYRYSVTQFARGMLRAGGRFDVFADRTARRDAITLGDDELLRSMVANIESTWRPPGGGHAGALAHDIIHGLDITEALDLSGPPPARIALAIRASGEKLLSHTGVDLSGCRLVASDTQLSVGDGPRAHELTSTHILLVVTGRRPLAS